MTIIYDMVSNAFMGDQPQSESHPAGYDVERYPLPEPRLQTVEYTSVRTTSRIPADIALKTFLENIK